MTSCGATLMAVDIRASDLWVVGHDNDTVLDLRSIQGLWTEQQYFVMTDHSRRLMEFEDGYIKVLPMPTRKHQVMLAFLYELFVAFMRPRGGIVLFAPLRIQVRPGKYREPDLLLLRDTHDPRNQNAFWLGADLVVEIVSPDDPERDTKVKRADYAEADIPEYWIADPEAESITVLQLAGDAYIEHGIFRRDEIATSALLNGFSMSVAAVLDAH
jgi:Uma2 family endonuclease